MKNLFALGLMVAVGASAQTASVVEVSHSSEQKVAALELQLQQKNRVQIEMQQHIDSLQQELNELRGLTETHSYRLNQILQRQRELYQELDKRFAAVKPTTAPSPTNINDPSPNGSLVLSMTQVYDNALTLALKEKKFKQAIVQFERYLTEFPNSTYSANAHYWLGQLLFNEGKVNKALVQFDILVTQYPDSLKRADAMVKMGQIAQGKQESAKAKAIYNRVIKQYPNKSAAQIARTRLSGLK